MMHPIEVRDITERKAHQLDLQKSQAKFQQLVDDIGGEFLIFSHSLTGEHLLNLINDILDISKGEAGRIVVQNADFSLKAVLMDLNMMFDAQARKRGLTLTVDVGLDVPEFINSDEKELRQILINLIGNAIRFTEIGGGSLRASSPGGRDSNVLTLELQNTGHGIAPEDLERIFDSFTQAKGDRTP